MGILSWKNSVLKIDPDGSIVATSFCRRDRNSAIQCNETRQYLVLGQGPQDRVVSSACVLDYHSGLKTPCVLATVSSSLGVIHEIYMRSKTCSAGAFQKSGMQFQVPREILPDPKYGDNLYHLLDGPTILWSKGTSIHFYRSHLVTVDLQTMVPSLRVKEIRRLWCLASPEDDEDESVLLLVQLVLQVGTIPRRQFGNREWLCVKVSLGSTVPAMRVPDCIPSCYGIIATCLSTHQTLSWVHSEYALLKKTCYFVGTELRQVVVMDDNGIRHILPLDFIPHQVVTMTGSLGNLVVAVMSMSGTVCAHTFQNKAPEDIVERWNRMENVLAGDFVQNGTNQLLLLKKNNGGFILTNFADIPATELPLAEEQEEELGGDNKVQAPPSTIISALRALQLKKHTGEAQLNMLQASRQQKYELLLKTLSFMEKIGSETTHPIPVGPDPGLVCLLPGSVDTLPSSDSGGTRRSSSPVLQVVKWWQRIYRGSWILGLLIKNVSTRAVAGVIMTVVTLGEVVVEPADTCQVLWNETNASQRADLSVKPVKDDTEQPPQKRARLMEPSSPGLCERVVEYGGRDELSPGHMICLTVTVSAPPPPGTEVTLVGSWREDASGTRMAEELMRVKLESETIVSGVLEIDLKCLDMWTGSYTVSNENLTSKEGQSLACFLAVHSLTQVSMTTHHTNLWRLPSMIRARLPLTGHTLQVHPRPTHSFSAPLETTPKKSVTCSMLESVALHLQLEAESAVLSILHKTDSDLKCVLRLLHDILPGDISMCLLAETQAVQHDRMVSCLSAVDKEVQSKMNSLQRTLDGTEEGGDRTVLHVQDYVSPSLAIETNALVATVAF